MKKVQFLALITKGIGPLKTITRPFGDSAAYLVVKDSGSLQSPATKQAYLLEFNTLLPDIVQDLTQRYNYIGEANKLLSKVLQYNMTGGSKCRGIAVVESFKILTETTDERLLREARLLGWCLELFYASVMMTQDVIDGAKRRRGKPCWYLQCKGSYDLAPRILEASSYNLLKHHFEKKSYYPVLLELFHNVSGKALLGQALDVETRADKTFSQFTMERYATIAKYKTSYISFKFPVALAMAMAGVEDPEVYRQAKTILLEMGHFFQVQVDYLNCYGRSSPPIEPGTDIEDGKCSWLSVVALQRLSSVQRKIFTECYGKGDEQKARVIRELYSLAGLRSTYKRFEEHSYELLCTQIQQVSRGLPHKIFLRFLKAMPGFTN